MKKACKWCEYYPNECGYWDPKERNKPKNKGASWVKADHIHNCQDFVLDPSKLSPKSEQRR